VLGLLLALGSSAVWGTADFIGGSVARRLPVVTVLLASQATALVALVVVLPATGGLHAPGAYLGWGIAFGLVGMVALAAFYRSLATGTMGVVAPIAGTGVAIPVLAGLAYGERPVAHQYAGMLLAVVGILLASAAAGPTDDLGAEAAAAGRRVRIQSVALAVVAAVGFGTVMVLIERGGRTSVGMTLLAARASSVLLLVGFVLIRRPAIGTWRPELRLLAAVGLLDVGANAAIAIAQRHAALSLVSVLASLYPVATVLLARSLHHERLSRAQAAGVTAALVGVLLIASTP
jgi:drug/metabolite transporter (DMT)-like permease